MDTFEKLEDYDYVFLMDCDTAAIDLNCEDFTEAIYAKIVDYPNPPLNVVRHLFELDHLEVTECKATFPIKDEQLTDWNNCNGGLYVISREFLPKLVGPWKRYATWCIDNKRELLGQHSKHIDQLSFALAMASLKKQVTHLNIEWNYPIHIKTDINVQPNMVHFHDCIDSQIKLKKTGLNNIDHSITLINKRISNSIRSGHLNSIFWDFRYQYYPELGSGIGSRGKLAEYKRNLLANCFNYREDLTVLDVGCGDWKSFRHFHLRNIWG